MKNRKRLTLILIIAIMIFIFWPIFLYSLLMFINDKIFAYLYVALVSLACIIYCLYLNTRVIKGVRIKYLWSKRKFTALLNEAISKFDEPSDLFVAKFKEIGYRKYLLYGDVFIKLPIEDRAWIYSDPKSFNKLITMVKALKESLDDDTRLIGFCEKIYNLDQDKVKLIEIINCSNLNKHASFILEFLLFSTGFQFSPDRNDINDRMENFVVQNLDPQIILFYDDIAAYLEELQKAIGDGDE